VAQKAKKMTPDNKRILTLHDYLLSHVGGSGFNFGGESDGSFSRNGCSGFSGGEVYAFPTAKG